MALSRKIIAHTPEVISPPQPENRSKLLMFPTAIGHLAYLDGLRGVVALYVVIFHALPGGYYRLITRPWDCPYYYLAWCLE